MTLQPTDIAKVAHAVNKAYCEAIGDHSQLHWDEAPDWQKSSAVAGVNYALSSENVTTEELHQSWLKVKREDGWKYGPVKDAAKKEHPCFVPYDQLPVEQRVKDHLFRAVVQTLKSL